MGDPPRPALKQARINFAKASDSTTKPASSSSSSTNETSSSAKRVPPACHDSCPPLKQARLGFSTASSASTSASASPSIVKVGKGQGDYVPTHHSLSGYKSTSAGLLAPEPDNEQGNKKTLKARDLVIHETYREIIREWELGETTKPRGYHEVPLTWSRDVDRALLWTGSIFNGNSSFLSLLNKVGITFESWRSFARQQALVNGVWLAWALQRGDIDESFVLDIFPTFTKTAALEVLGPAGLLGPSYSAALKGSWTANDGALGKLASQRFFKTVKSINVPLTISMIEQHPHHPTHAALLTNIKESNTAALPQLNGPPFPALDYLARPSSAERWELLPTILSEAQNISAWIEHDHARARRQLLPRLGRGGARTIIWALLVHDWQPFYFYWLRHLDDSVIVDILIKRLPAAVAKGLDNIKLEDLVSADVMKLIDAAKPVPSEAEKARYRAAAKRSRQQAKNRKRAHPRVYWKRMARNAALRTFGVEKSSQLDDEQRPKFKVECARLFRIIVRLALKAPRCHYCRVKLTFIAYQGKKSGIETEEDLAYLATNASLEAIVPRHAGGIYDDENSTLACSPCNTLKMGWPADNFRVFLYELVKATRKVEGNLLVAQPQPTPTRSLNKEEEDDVEGFLDARRKEIISGYRNGTRAECKMSTKEMVNEVKDQCLPDGMYNDPCGLVLPLAVGHIDRIVSTRPYEPGNIRLYYAGFNFMKRLFDDDWLPILYLKNLVDNFDETSVKGLLEAGVEPLVASTFFGGCKKNWHRSCYTEVYQHLDFSSLFADDDEDDDEEEEEEDDE